MTIPYYHIDAFTSTLFAGNPAGVCILPEFLAVEAMQRIAAENRHSQTAFAVRRSPDDFDLRWFTPTIEDDLCGHATLATAYALALRGQDIWPVRFHTRSGILPVARDGDRFALDFPVWEPQPCEPPATLLPALGLTTGEVFKTRDYLVIVERAAQVRALAPDLRALAAIDIGIGGMIVSAPGDDGADYVSRFFAPAAGIDEDPVTGSTNCTLAPYWARRLGKSSLRTQQLSPRGGELRCTVAGDRVTIAGEARLYLHGNIEV